MQQCIFHVWDSLKKQIWVWSFVRAEEKRHCGTNMFLTEIQSEMMSSVGMVVKY